MDKNYYYTNKEYNEKDYNRIEAHKNEYNEFDLESYERGYDDGYKDGYNDMKFFAASVIYEYWDEFIRDCFVNKKDEMDCINNMVKFFTVNHGTVSEQ